MTTTAKSKNVAIASELPGGVTPEQVEAWKAQYEEVYVMQLTTDKRFERVARAIMYKPSLLVLNTYLRSSESNLFAANRTLYKTVTLAGDTEIEQDNTHINTVINQLMKKVSGEASEALPLSECDTDEVPKHLLESEAVKKALRELGKEKIYLLRVPKDESFSDFHVSILRYPNEGTLQEYLKLSRKWPVRASRNLIKKSLLAGDEVILDHTQFYLSAAEALGEEISDGLAETKKL